MKKVLVTGAGGFIGSHVVEELIKENIEVRALIRQGEFLTNLKELEIEKVESDVLDTGAVLKAMAGVDTVFHLAAKKGKTGELYILGNMNVTMKEFMQLAYKAAGFTAKPILTFPVPMLKISASVFKYWADNISHKIPLTTPPEVSYASQYLFFDNTKARNELGLTLTPIEKSLCDSVRGFRENSYAP
jgi:nucleoside-diphosphate-sugar epimerase